MKKIKQLLKTSLFLWIVVTCFSYITVNAAGASIRASSTNVTTGKPVTITVSFSGAETWNLHLSGAISDDSFVGLSLAGPTSESRTWNLNTSNPGTYSVTLSGDVSETSAGTSYVNQTVTVTVTSPPPPPPDSHEPTTPTTPSTPSQLNPSTAGDERSSNVNLSKITVDQYSLQTDDNIHYKVSVPHSVDSVTIEAVAEDSKAKVTGGGKVSLKVGENPFEIVVTAENGATRTYTVTVTRKDTKYPLSDYQNAIKDNDDVSIVLGEKDVITKEMLEAIQKAKKKMRFVYYKGDEPVYSWIVDGTQLSNLHDFSTQVTFSFDDEDSFDKASGYRKGIYLQFGEQNGFPEGVEFQANVGDHFKGKDQVYLYTYDKNKNLVKQVGKALTVENGIIRFDLQSKTQYFLSKALIGVEQKPTSDKYALAAGIEFVVLFLLVCYVILSSMKKKKKPTDENPVI